MIVVELIGGSVTNRGPNRNPKAFPPSRRNQDRPRDVIENVCEKVIKIKSMKVLTRVGPNNSNYSVFE